MRFSSKKVKECFSFGKKPASDYYNSEGGSSIIHGLKEKPDIPLSKEYSRSIARKGIGQLN